MNKRIFIVVVFCLILVGTLFYLYTIYKPSEDYKYVNVSICATENRERIKTGYEIQPYNLIGNTSSSYQQMTILKGEINITNKNLGKQNYYENSKTYNIEKNTRIDLILTKPETPKIKTEYEKNLIILEISSSNFQEVDFCIIGSINYIFLKAEPRTISFYNLTNDENFMQVRSDTYDYEDYPGYHIVNKFGKEIEYEEIIKEGYGDYDICYDGEFSLENSNKILNISYTQLGTSDESDYINIALIDKMGNELTEKIK